MQRLMIQNIMLVVYQGSIENDLFGKIKDIKKRKKTNSKRVSRFTRLVIWERIDES